MSELEQKLKDAYELAESLYDSGDLSIDQATPILDALKQAAARVELDRLALEAARRGR